MIFFLVITMFIGVSLNRMNLRMTGVGIMIAWTLWLVVIIVLIEFIERRYKKRMYNLNLAYLSGK